MVVMGEFRRSIPILAEHQEVRAGNALNPIPQLSLQKRMVVKVDQEIELLPVAELLAELLVLHQQLVRELQVQLGLMEPSPISLEKSVAEVRVASENMVVLRAMRAHPEDVVRTILAIHRSMVREILQVMTQLAEQHPSSLEPPVEPRLHL